MIVSQDSLKFETTKRSFYANNEIIGIDPKLFVTEGYDGSIGEPASFTKEERMELADYMIGVWTRFKNYEEKP